MFDDSLEAKLILELSSGPKKSVALVTGLAKREDVSIQAVYASLKKLRLAEVVVAQHKVYSLNSVWIEKISNLVSQVRNTYSLQNSNDSFSFAGFEEGDRAVYRFKNPVLFDQVWGHLFFVLAGMVTQSIPIMIYNPHYWFPIVREASERVIFTWLRERGLKAYFSSKSTEFLDAVTIKNFLKDTGHSYSLGVHNNFKNNFYLNVIGDYVIQVYLDQNIGNRIDDFFKTKRECLETDKRFLQKIVSTTGKNKLVIHKNSKLAKRYRKILGKDFLIPAESREFV